MGLHFTVTNSRSEEQRLLTVLVLVHQLLLPEFFDLLCRCAVRPASSIASSGMDGCSQVSVNSRMQLFSTMPFVATCSFSSSVLLARDLKPPYFRQHAGPAAWLLPPLPALLAPPSRGDGKP